MTMTIDQSATSVRPYSLLAPVYDSMMRSVAYPEWADYYESVFKTCGTRIFEVYDIACGTGSLLLELFQKGYLLSGSDISPEMIAIARKKCERLALDIPLSVETMTTLREADSCDAVICSFDSMNYLTTPDEWQLCFTAVYSMLRSGGIFIFDVSTEKNSRQNFDKVLEVDRLNRFKRISEYHPGTRMQVNRIEMVIHDRVFAEEHRQRIYSISEVQSMISRSLFSVVSVFDHLTFSPGNEESERVHFVLKK